MESEIKKKKKLRRKARAGYRVQKQKNKEALVLALQENRSKLNYQSYCKLKCAYTVERIISCIFTEK